MSARPKEKWGSRVGVILAVAGCAVGLGNFLRFPGQAAQYGGGAFMVPYFLTLLVALPIGWAEWTMGRLGGQLGFNSAPAIFGAIGRNKFWRYVGVFGLLIPLCVYFYYIYIEAWCLAYAWMYLTGDMSTLIGGEPSAYAANSEALFSSFTGQDADGALFDPGRPRRGAPLLLFWGLVFVMNFILIYRGIAKGIEWFCNLAMPVMAVCSVLVLIRVLTLGTPDPAHPEQNVLNGLGYMWNPHSDPGKPWWTSLFLPDVWLAAGGQLFFSLGIGFGVIINYASYLSRKDDVVLSGLTAASTNEFFEVCMGGMITIPAAFIFLGSSLAISGTFGMGFVTMPAVFQHMPPVMGIPTGPAVGFIWFFMLFLAAITSSLGMLQPVIAFLEEALGIGRRASAAILAIISVFGSAFVIYFSKGMAALDTIDFWVGTAMIYLVALFQAVLFGWVLGTKRGIASAMEGAAMRLPPGFPILIRYVAPLFLAVIFVLWLINTLPGKVRELAGGGVPLFSILLIGVTFAFLCMLTALGGERWKAEERGRRALELSAEEA
jgi:NSS family neurotransmitter:Na+ symporter